MLEIFISEKVLRESEERRAGVVQVLAIGPSDRNESDCGGNT